MMQDSVSHINEDMGVPTFNDFPERSTDMSAFDRAQAAHDANTEPPEVHEHEEWSSINPSHVTSQTQDIPIECDECKATGTLDFNDSETFSINWD